MRNATSLQSLLDFCVALRYDGFYHFVHMKFRIIPLLLTLFIDSVGFGLVLPLFSTLFFDPVNGIVPEATLSTRGTLYGLLIASFAIGQFFGSPLIGALSDRKGRKKVLLITLLLACASYFCAAIAIMVKNVWLLFFGRLASGVAGGNFSVAQSSIADQVQKEDKAKTFALLGAAWGVGFVVGPFIGGRLADLKQFSHPMALPFWFAFVLCAINVLTLAMTLKETLPKAADTRLHLGLAFNNLKKAFSLPHLKGLFVVLFIIAFGWGFFTEFSPVWLMKKLAFDYKQTANFFGFVGLCVALCQGVLTRPILKRAAPERLFPVALAGLGIACLMSLLVRTHWQVYPALLGIAFTEALVFTTASTLVSNLSDETAQGEMLGLNNSIQWAAIGLCPLFSGSFVAHYPGLPLLVCGIAMFLALSTFKKIFKSAQELS